MMFMSTWNVTDARAHLPEILQRVEDGDEVTLTRHGRAVAVILRPDTVRSRRAASALDTAAQILSSLDEAGRSSEPRGLSPDRAEELIAAIRADRDRT